MKANKQKVKQSLVDVIDQWVNYTQDGEWPFDCYIGDETVNLMATAAFSAIEAVEDAQGYLKREGLLNQ
jgi:hypothetical protein